MTKVVCKSKCVHGTCIDGRCSCRPGWYGESCSVKKAPTCPNDCKGSLAQRGASILPRGICSSEGKCLCSPGFGGSDCSVTCQKRCSGQGECVQSVAVAKAAAGRKALGPRLPPHRNLCTPERAMRTARGEFLHSRTLRR